MQKDDYIIECQYYLRRFKFYGTLGNVLLNYTSYYITMEQYKLCISFARQIL